MKNLNLFLASAILLFFFSYVSALSDTSNEENIYPITVPSIVDGTPFGVNGHELKKMLYILKKIEDLLKGNIDPATKERAGKYLFQGKFLSIKQLVNVEKNINSFDKNSRDEFYRVFEQAREDFIKINEPYLDQVQAGKLITLKFMEEWATKHDREDTYLLAWAKEKPTHEFESFRQKIITFELLDTFCNDLISFISDLIRSCPRAWQQFIELQQKKT
jgi:hypothetical protein